MENDNDGMFEVTDSEGNRIQFRGELVSHVSSELPEKPRHTEFSLFLTEANTWILQGVGKSRVPGERDRPWYIVTSDPADFLDKILGEDVSRLAKRLLKDAFLFLRDCD